MKKLHRSVTSLIPKLVKNEEINIHQIRKRENDAKKKHANQPKKMDVSKIL